MLKYPKCKIKMSDWCINVSKIHYGIPQGFVLGPVLFTLYMLPVGNNQRPSINFHMQLRLYVKPEETYLLARLQACLKDIKDWMTSNILLLNSDKTSHCTILQPKHLRTRLSDRILSTGSLFVLQYDCKEPGHCLQQGHVIFPSC